MKEIPLTQEKIALVDDNQYQYLSQFKWNAYWDGHNWYAMRTESYPGGGQRTLSMHRVILEVNDPLIKVDHRDGNGLNNQTGNLRKATHQQNLCNQRRRSDNHSGFKGVHWRKDLRKWRSQITIGGKHKHLGYYGTPEEAARAYDAAARELHGEFARTNFQEATPLS